MNGQTAYPTGAATNSANTTATPSATQRHRRQRPRVFAGFDLIWQLGRLASLALGGVTTDTLGIPAVYAAGESSGKRRGLAAGSWPSLVCRPHRGPPPRGTGVRCAWSRFVPGCRLTCRLAGAVDSPGHLRRRGG